MKVCFVNILFAMKDQRGGLGAHIADLSAELSRSGHEVTVLTSGSGQPYIDQGVKIVPLGKVARYHRSSQFLNPLYLLQRALYMGRMTAHVLRSDFDVVEAAEGGIEHLFLILFRNCPLITKLHGNFRYIYSSRGALVHFIEKLEAFVVRRSDGIYTSSLAYAETLSRDYGVCRSRIRIIPYGIDVPGLDAVKKLENKEIAALTSDKTIVFLSVGSSPERKGARVFIEAASRFTQAGVLFVLSCSDKAFLNGTVLPKNLVLLPNLGRTDFYSWIRRADIVVFPSQFESFSIAVREAMLFNKAMVLSPGIPLDDIDNDYPRLTVLERIDSRLLADAVIEHVATSGLPLEVDADYYNRLRDKYDIRRIASLSVEFYEEVGREFWKGSHG